jgi:CelD/BcsL family acetyltransferase involved in cellulose biosynthesis
MTARIVADPVEDPSWSELLDSHPAASIFHSPGWLNALRQTYGYEPFVVTTSRGPALQNGVVLCRVNGWRRRLVSLPFSDHCDPLVDKPDDLSDLIAHVAREVRNAGWRSVEWRPRTATGDHFETAVNASGLKPSDEYCLHRLDLRREPTEVFRGFHPSSTQRAIRRAERAGITYEVGTSDRLRARFYRLLRMTRRRHGVPPQPMSWFRNLFACLGDQIAIHEASKDGRAIASIITAVFKKTMYYKYGGSDASFHRLGAMPFLFWRVIRDAHARGCNHLDLGRSNIDQPGLIAFKDHLGATCSSLNYYRYPGTEAAATRHPLMTRVARGVCARLPDATLDLAGRLLYRHLG